MQNTFNSLLESKSSSTKLARDNLAEAKLLKLLIQPILELMAMTEKTEFLYRRVPLVNFVGLPAYR